MRHRPFRSLAIYHSLLSLHRNLGSTRLRCILQSSSGLSDQGKRIQPKICACGPQVLAVLHHYVLCVLLVLHEALSMDAPMTYVIACFTNLKSKVAS